MSHDLLDDLLVDVPRHVAPDAGAAWRAGAGRRRRRYAVEGLAVAAAVVVGLLGVGLVDPPDTSPVPPAGQIAGLAGHPGTVPRPFFEEELPDRPGLLAGALETEDRRWHAIDQDGRTWRLPTDLDHYPALSDNGRMLGQLVPDGADRAVYETLDLATGDRTSYDAVGDGTDRAGRALTGQPYWAAEQSPSYWSPDGARLLLRGGRVDGTSAQDLLLENGVVTTVPGSGFPVGWASTTSIVWLAYDGSEARITDLAGAVLRVVPLHPTRPIKALSQWSGRVSPDGGRLAVFDVDESGLSRVWAFSLADGSVVPGYPSRPGTGSEPTCPLAWQDDRVTLSLDDTYSFPRMAEEIPISDRWGPRACVTWAAQALAGPVQPAPGLTEWRYWQLWWHWGQLLLGAGGVVGLTAVGVWHRRRRRVEPETSVDWWA